MLGMMGSHFSTPYPTMRLLQKEHTHTHEPPLMALEHSPARPLAALEMVRAALLHQECQSRLVQQFQEKADNMLAQLALEREQRAMLRFGTGLKFGRISIVAQLSLP